MVFIFLHLILSCAETVGKLPQHPASLSLVQKYPEGWPELQYSPKDLERLAERSFFKSDPKLQNLHPFFWPALHLQIDAWDESKTIRESIRNRPRPEDVYRPREAYF